MLIDTHAHLNFPELMTNIDGVLERAKKTEVAKLARFWRLNRCAVRKTNRQMLK